MKLKNVSAFLIAFGIAIGLYSCDKDFIELESNVIGDNHFDLLRYDQATVVAFNQATGFVQTNNLPALQTDISVNSLGYYNNPAFGATTSHFVSQVELRSVSPVFTTNVVMDSVYLEVPYFNRRVSVTDGDSTYELDSLTTGTNSKFKLNVYESGYFIPDLDPSPESNLQERIRLYNDQRQTFESYKKGALEDGTSVFNGPRLNYSIKVNQNEEFFFNPAEIILTKTATDGTKTTTRRAPAMRLELNKNFFKKKIIEAPATALSNNSSFRNYFRGLYFQVENPTGNSLAALNFTQGTITLYYTEDRSTTTNGTTTVTRVQRELIISLSGNRMNLLEQTYSPNYAAALNPTNINTVTGDEKLFIKGGEGSVAVIDLFGRTEVNRGETPELEALRNQFATNNWLINEANLTFYIDQDAMAQSVEPRRIYLYDMTHRKVIADYAARDEGPAGFPKFNKPRFGGFLEETNGKGVRYKIRITNHISNLLSKDSTNVRLGIVVTEAINDTRFTRVKPGQATNQLFSRLPVASVLNPFGTILFGSNPAVDDSKRLKLEIYYTQPN